MSIATDLMGLGESSQLAQRVSTGGTGPFFVTALGNNQATSYKIGKSQYGVFVNGGAGGTGVSLPSSAGGETGCLLWDDFILHNGTGGNILLYVPTGVTINIGGANYTSAAPFTIPTLKTVTAYPVSSTQWFGLSA